MSETPAHHTAENWAARPRSVEEFVVAKVEDYGDNVALTSTRSWGFMRPKADLGRTIAVGERLQLETIQASHITGLRDDNGWLFRVTNQQLADQSRRFDEDLRRKQVVRLEQQRKLYAEREAALPEWLQARIRKFREKGGEEFLLTGWGYELVICRLADLFDRGREAEADNLASDEGVTGNQWDCAKALASARKQYGDGPALSMPAGLAPLTGSADYS